MKIEDLGFTPEEVLNKVIERIADSVMRSAGYDEEGHEVEGRSSFAVALHERVKERIDEAIGKRFDEHVGPNVSKYVEEISLQETTKWGEARGEPVSFTEYLVQRAEKYLTEEVNYDGKGKGKNDYHWKGHTTRITHLVNTHLHFAIERAMEMALANANSTIAKGLEGAVKIALENATKALKVAVTTK